MGLILQETSQDSFTWRQQSCKESGITQWLLKPWFRTDTLISSTTFYWLKQITKPSHIQAVWIDSKFWWEVLQKLWCKKHGHSIRRKIGNIFVIIVSYSIPSAVTIILILLFIILMDLFIVSMHIYIVYIHILLVNHKMCHTKMCQKCRIESIIFCMSFNNLFIKISISCFLRFSHVDIGRTSSIILTSVYYFWICWIICL